MIGRGFLTETRGTSVDPFRSLPDAGDVTPVYAAQISGMLYDRYIGGSADGRLNPKRGVTRAEVMKVVDNLVDVLIDRPGVYTVPYGQNTLVLCKGVTLELEQYKGGGTQPNRTYLMGQATDNGVSFRSAPGNTRRPSTTLCYVSDEPATFTLDGSCDVGNHTNDQKKVLSAWFLPDTRFAGRGREDFPYILSTPEQFRLLAEFYGESSTFKYFKLSNDIDLGTLSAPIGSKDHSPISTNLDGNGYTVTYQMNALTLNESTCGLFYAWKGIFSEMTLTATPNPF